MYWFGWGGCSLLVLGWGSCVAGVVVCVCFVIGNGLSFPKFNLIPNWDMNQRGWTSVNPLMTLIYALILTPWLPP